MTSEGIGLRSRQVPPRDNVELPLGGNEGEESEVEEFVQREASAPPQQLEFEDAILFSELDSMDNMLSSGGQLKFTGDPGGPTLTHLRQSWAATEVDLKLKPATVGLTDDDRFHLLVRLTGGGAREQCGLLQETLQQEVKARNAPIQREYQLALLTYQGELAEYEALTEEQKAAVDRPAPPDEPVLSNSFIQPLARLWNLLENLYPERSTARIQEFREFQMKPAESMANMVSRLQTLKLVLKQPEPASVFKFLDAIRPKPLADKVKDILRIKEMDPNEWTVKEVGDIAIRLEKAQGEESLWTTSKPNASVLPSAVMSSGSSLKNTTVTCYNCGRTGHMAKNCRVKSTRPTKKAVSNARSSFANPKANRSDDRVCYTCNKPGHIAKDCSQQRPGNVTKPMKGKPWCSLHKINTHSSESCWVLHPELRPSYLKERTAAHSARRAKVVPAKLGSSLSVKLKPALLSATKDDSPDVNQTMDSYYAEVVTDASPYYHMADLFAVNVRAAATQRRSSETQRLRQVTQADMPLSYLPYPDAAQEQNPPNMEPVPPVFEDYPAGGDNTRRGKNVVDQDLLDATNLNHHSSEKSDNEKMPESFGYLSEGDPDFQGTVEFVMEKQLPRNSSVLRNGSERRENASDHEEFGSETPQEGRPIESSINESREILKQLSAGDNISLTNNTQQPAEEIPGVSLTRDNISSGTRRMRKDDRPGGG